MAENKLFVIFVHYQVELSKIESVLKEHRDWLQNGYNDGFLLASGPREPRDGGIIIGKFHSKKDAESFTHHDPFYKHNFAKYEIFEFTAVLHNAALKSFLQ